MENLVIVNLDVYNYVSPLYQAACINMQPKRGTGERRPKTTLPVTANAASTKLYTFL